MKVTKHRKGALLLLFLFTAYWCGISFFTHSHVENGVKIVHSHPFKSAHHHTEEQFETIFFASFWCTPEMELPDMVESPFYVLLAVYDIDGLESAKTSNFHSEKYLRGPPCLRG